jgi:tetratricopeptide (TPR) repeat protein
MHPGRFPSVLLALCALPAVAFGDEWVGKKVMPAKWGVAGNATEQKNEIPASWLIGVVRRVEGDKLLVRVVSSEAWMKKEEVVTLEQAVPYFTNLLKSNPNDELARCKRGWASAEKGELDEAIKDFDELIRSAPETSEWFNLRGRVYALKGELDKAIQDYSEANRLEPDNAGIYSNRAFAYSAKKDFDKAIHDFDEAIRLLPEQPALYANRALAYIAKKDFDKALTDCNEAIRLGPTFPAAYGNRGVVHYNRKEYAKAINDYKQAVQLAPNEAEFRYPLAWYLATCPDHKLRDGKKAVEHARRACELTRWKVAIYVSTLAAAYAEAGDFEQAVNWQKKALENPSYSKACGDAGRRMLELFEKKNAYRDQ